MFINYLKNNDTPVASTTLKPYHLKERLLKNFSKEINIISFKGDSIVKSYKGIMIKNEAHRDEILDAASLILHEEILKIKTNKIPAKVQTKHLIEGEAEVPVIISKFQKKVIAGTNYRRLQHPRTDALAKSFSEDLIYATFNGSVKLSKQICLGLALKSLTNSKKIINILHRYGHCRSYSTLEGLETEATFTFCERTDVCPDGIVRLPGLLTGVAYDNYDRFVDRG